MLKCVGCGNRFKISKSVWRNLRTKIVQEKRIQIHFKPNRSFASVSFSRSNLPPQDEWRDKEITLYVKGFLSRTENPEDFDDWKNSHNQLSTKKEWSGRAHGFYWENGKNPYSPISTAMKAATVAYRRGRIGAILQPQTLAIIGAQELLYTGTRLYFEYRNAHKYTEENAHKLADYLSGLHHHYEKIRVVAHSLGCKLLLESMKELPLAKRPHEVHLLAPAVIEEEYEDILHNLAGEKGHSYLYYCNRDVVLGVFYKLLHNDDEPLGTYGPKKDYHRLHALDVDKHFDTFVHFDYRFKFHEFAASPSDILPISPM